MITLQSTNRPEMEKRQTPPIILKVSNANPDKESNFSSREATAHLEQLNPKHVKGKTNRSPESTGTAITSSNTPLTKNLSTPPAGVPLAASVSKGNSAYERSVNASRITMHSNLVPTETQDVSWSEIDTLDDVKKMAKEPIVNDGFPLDFEDKLTQMRRSHAQLLSLMRERNKQLKSAQPKFSTTPGTSSSKDQHGAAAMNQGQGLEHGMDDPEVAIDGENYVSQIVDTIKGLDR